MGGAAGARQVMEHLGEMTHMFESTSLLLFEGRISALQARRRSAPAAAPALSLTGETARLLQPPHKGARMRTRRWQATPQCAGRHLWTNN